MDKCGSMESCLAVSLLANNLFHFLLPGVVGQSQKVKSEMKLREIHLAGNSQRKALLVGKGEFPKHVGKAAIGSVIHSSRRTV